MEEARAEELAVLWTAAQRLVRAFVSTILSDFHAVEEVLQNTAVAVVRKFAEFDRDRPFTSWAVGIARNEVLAHRRRAAASPVVFSDVLVSRIAEGYVRLGEDESAREEALRACLDGVAGTIRRALDLCYGEGLKPAAVAARIEMTEGATRTLLSRARAALRECIEQRLTMARGR